PIKERLPTVALRGRYNHFVADSVSGRANVNRRLTMANFNDTVALERLSGGAEIPAASYSVSSTGDFEGDVMVSMTAEAPVAPAPGPDVYAGPLIATFPGEDPAP